MEPSRQRVQPLRWNGSAWDALEPLAVPQGGGLWALATDAAGTRLGAVWAGMPDTSTSLMRAWVRNPGGPGQPWVERSGGTLPGAGFGGFLSDLQLVRGWKRSGSFCRVHEGWGRADAVAVTATPLATATKTIARLCPTWSLPTSACARLSAT
jgi:hypothetical protein